MIFAWLQEIKRGILRGHNGRPAGRRRQRRSAVSNQSGVAAVVRTIEVLESRTLLTAPTVMTPTLSGVTSTTATLGGDVTADGGSTLTAVGVLYSLTSANANPQLGGTGVINVPGTATTGVFTLNATGLTPGASYSFTAYATNSDGTTYTTPVSTFTELAVAPSLTSPTLSGVTSTTATLGGNVTGDGGSALTAVGVLYALTSANANPQLGGTGVVNVPGTAATGVFTLNASGLTPGASYSYVAYATNGIGTTYTSPVSTFSELAVAPTLTSPTLSAVTSTTVTLGGNVTGDGGSTLTAVGVLYSLTSANANPQLGGTGVINVPGTATTGVFTLNASGLTPGASYSYVAYATNGIGTTYTSPVSTFSELAVAPTLTSPTLSGVTSTTATLGGNVTANGGSTLTAVGVLYALTSANANPQLGGTGVINVPGTATTGVFTLNASGLTPGASYSYVAYATNGIGTTYTSPVSTFTELSAPTLTTPTLSGVTSTTATLGGDVTSDGGSTLTAVGVLYSLTSANVNPQLGGTGVINVPGTATTGVFTLNASGLTPGASYSYVAYATNGIGTTYTSPVSTFSELAVAPTLTTPTLSAVTSTTATLGGDVTGDGGSTLTAVGVLYSLTSANANPQLGGTGVINVPGTAATGVFTLNASGLTPGASYSYVAYATNGIGTTYTSPVSTFSELAVAPTLTTPTLSGVTSTTATLGGNVTANGGSTLTAVGVLYAMTSANANPQLGGTGVINVPGTATTGVFTLNASGLTPGASYSYVAYATNGIGTTYTSPVSTFNALAQTVVTQGSTNIANNTGIDSFGTVIQGSTPVTQTFTVTNSGATDLVLQPATVTANSGFSIVSNFTAGQIVTPGSTATLTMQMDTSTVGSPSATVSFASSDSANSPFTFNVKGSVIGTVAQTIIDDSSPGFSTTGSWSQASGQGFDNDVHFAPAGNGSDQATWSFSGLAPGQYLVTATWSPYANRATNAPYTILDSVGGSVLASAMLNQQLTPSSEIDGGASWQTIGTVNVVGSTLVVQLNNQANNYVIADAIQVQRVGALAQTIVTQGTTSIVNGTGIDSFGTVTQGSTPVTQTFTVTNSGATDLVLQPATVTANSGFSIVSNFTAGQIVTPGSTATLTMQMDTSTVGSPSATVSFASSDSANSPFTFNVNGSVTGTIIDDSSPGFSTTGSWSQASGQGFDNDVHFAPAGNGSDQATWSFSGLAPGQYLVTATWSTNANRATNAPFTILDSVGGTVLASAMLNQQLTPSSEIDGGASWQTIGTVNVVGSTLVVQLNNQANNYVIADAVQVQRVGALAQTVVTQGSTNIANNTGIDSFGTVIQGSTPVTQTFTVTNSGATNLVLQPATVTANSGFSIVSNFTAGQIVTPGSTATLTMQMDTSTVGSPSATVSFASSDSANSPFTFNVKGSVIGTVAQTIIDDSSPGFSTTGSWSQASGQGFDNDVHFAPAGNGSDQATWSFSGLAPGQYLVTATWSPYANRATNAPYTILDSVGGSVLASAMLNQQLTPSSEIDGGASWQTIGTVNVVGSTLVVQLNNQANNYVIADAIQVQRVGALAQTIVTQGTTSIVNGTGIDSFGTVAQGSTPVTQTFTVTNSGATDLVLQPATVTANSGFSIVSNFTAGQIVTPGSTATLTMQMDTSTVGSPSATVSFASSDSANSPFTFNVNGSVTGTIIDDSSPGFSTTGSWSQASGQGFDNDVHFAPAGNGSDQATWSFSGLAPGQYLVTATWSTNANRATNAPYTILDSVGGTVLASAMLNQQLTPSSEIDGGASWQIIGTVNVVGSTLVVQLNNQANNYVIADAIQIQRVAPVLG